MDELKMTTIDELGERLEQCAIKPLMRRSGVNRHTIMNIRDGINRNPTYRVMAALVTAINETEAEKVKAEQES